ncbi:MAG: hypothetical protein QM473_03700 [Acidobacteriota bacterium]|nr:hypothetical protein [Acidobacteriota bacterium]
MRRLPPTAMAGLALLVLSASLAQAAPAPVTGAVICHGVTPKGQPISPASWFPKGARAIYVWFRAGEVPPGTRAHIRWSLNGGTLKTDEVALNSGRPAWNRYEIALGEPLPLGRYEAQVTVGDSAPIRASAQVGGDEPLPEETRAVQPDEPAPATGVSALSRSDRNAPQPGGSARLARAASPELVAPVIGPSAPAPSETPAGILGPAVVAPPMDAIAPEEPAASPVVVTGPSLADAPPAGPPVPSGILAIPSVEAPEVAIRIAPRPPAVVDDSMVLRVTDPGSTTAATTWTAGAGVVSVGAPAPAVVPAPVAASAGPAITIPEAAPGVVTFYPPVLGPAGTTPGAPGTVPPASSQPESPAPEETAPSIGPALSEPLGPRTQPSGGAQPVVKPPPAEAVASAPAGPSAVPSTASGASVPRHISPVRADEPESAADSGGSRPLIARSATSREPATRSARGPEPDAAGARRPGTALLLPTRPKARPIPGGPAPDEPIVEAPPAEVKPLLVPSGSSESAEPSAAVGDYVPVTMPPAAPGASAAPVERPEPVTAPPAPEVRAPIVPEVAPAAPAGGAEPGAEAVAAPEKTPTPAGNGAPESAPAPAETPPMPTDTAPRVLVMQAPLIAGIGAEDLPPVELPDTAVKLHYVELIATPEPAGLQPMWIARAPDGRLWPPGMPTQLGLSAGENPDPDPSTLLLYSDHVDGITPLYEVPRGEAMLHAVRENDAALLYVSREMFDQRRQAWLETARDWRWMWYVRQVDLSLGQRISACLYDLARSRRVPEAYQATGRTECLLIGPDGQRISPSTVTPELCAALSPSIEGAEALPADDPVAFIAGLEAGGVQALTVWTAPASGRYQVWSALPVDRAAASCKVWLEK